jgi:HD superfamily phosphohydrolase YqeK
VSGSVVRVPHGKRIYLLVALVTAAAGASLFIPEWQIPESTAMPFWYGIIAFALLGIACDTSFLRISFANVNSSVAFIPFIAAISLFDHPWPMVIAGLTAVVVDSVVRRKETIRVWYNTAQYMLTAGLGGIVYRALGGSVGVDTYTFHFIPFVGLIVTYFTINSGSVALAVALSSGVSLRESWSRIVGGSLVYDVFSSSLAILLAYLYVQMDLMGVALLVLPLFFVRHFYQMTLQLEQVNKELLELMVKAIEARDPYTSGHSVRVAEYARLMSRELGLPSKLIDTIETAALMHDVGKIHEDFAPLLRKEGRLTPEERIVMQTHPARSAELVGTIAGFRGPVQEAVKYHHENFDGTGYPEGLSGRGIPVGARIIMIADTIDAMTTDRPYRMALGFERVVQELRRFSGSQFDPELVELVVSSTGIRRLVDGPPPLPSEPPIMTRREGSGERLRRAAGSGSWGAKRSTVSKEDAERLV